MMNYLQRILEKQCPSTIPPKRIIYLGISVMKEVKDLYYRKNYETLMKEITEDRNRKTFCVHGLIELVLLNTPYPK